MKSSLDIVSENLEQLYSVTGQVLYNCIFLLPIQMLYSRKLKIAEGGTLLLRSTKELPYFLCIKTLSMSTRIITYIYIVT